MKVVVGGSLVAAAGLLLAVFAPAQPLALAGFLLVGIGASNIVPVLFTAAGNQARMPASLAIAAITTLGYAGILVGPAAIGIVAEHWSLSFAFVMVAVGMVFVAVSWPFTARR
jgi:predicted MFS family arabinose efflux permease